MDEQNIDAMIKSMEKEKRTDPRYFQDILCSALVIAARVMEEDMLDIFTSLCESMVKWNLDNKRYRSRQYYE